MYRVAIVDDNETWCFVLALRLQQQGYSVSTFTTGYKFFQEADQFDLVLVDFSIPTPAYQVAMDGPEVICKVKQTLDRPPILVLISGFFTEDLLGHARYTCPEADAVLCKQTEVGEMLRVIEQLLADKNAKGQRNLKEESTSSEKNRVSSQESLYSYIVD